MDDETLIYSVPGMAEFLGISESTMRRRLRHPVAACFRIVPISNAGGGYGFSRAGQVNSLTALGANIHVYALSTVPIAPALTEASSGAP